MAACGGSPPQAVISVHDRIAAACTTANDVTGYPGGRITTSNPRVTRPYLTALESESSKVPTDIFRTIASEIHTILRETPHQLGAKQLRQVNGVEQTLLVACLLARS